LRTPTLQRISELFSIAWVQFYVKKIVEKMKSNIYCLYLFAILSCVFTNLYYCASEKVKKNQKKSDPKFITGNFNLVIFLTLYLIAIALSFVLVALNFYFNTFHKKYM